MTQLLLFDAPAHSTFPVPAESPEPSTDRSERQGKDLRRTGRRQEKAEERSGRQLNAIDQLSAKEKVAAEELAPPRGGVHRMGDLASLVIARYELVAKRRAALLARGPLPSVRF